MVLDYTNGGMEKDLFKIMSVKTWNIHVAIWNKHTANSI